LSENSEEKQEFNKCQNGYATLNPFYVVHMGFQIEAKEKIYWIKDVQKEI
jgi:hypothetical protein